MSSICEKCKIEHNGEYGSGRFCSKKCSKSYSTKNKREEINFKVSQKLKGIKTNDAGFKSGFDKRRYVFKDIDKIKSKEKIQEKRTYELGKQFDNINIKAIKFEKIKIEQEYKCLYCKLNEWMGKSLVLELHHVDGDHDNSKRENLMYLCPNCHSQTPNWKRKK